MYMYNNFFFLAGEIWFYRQTVMLHQNLVFFFRLVEFIYNQ